MFNTKYPVFNSDSVIKILIGEFAADALRVCLKQNSEHTFNRFMRRFTFAETDVAVRNCFLCNLDIPENSDINDKLCGFIDIFIHKRGALFIFPQKLFNCLRMFVHKAFARNNNALNKLR